MKRSDAKFIFGLILLVTCLLGFVDLGFAEEVKLEVTASKAAIRIKPMSEAAVVTEVPQGTQLSAQKKQGAWYQISVRSEDGDYTLSGFIHEDHVRIQGEPVPRAAKAKVQQPPEKVQEVNTPEPLPQPASNRKQKHQFYGKVLVGGGFGFSKIFIGTLVTENKTEDINIQPGGGGHLAFSLGYRLPMNLKLELGVGYQSSGIIASNANARFQRIPLKLSVLYEFASPRKFKLYAGAGPVYFVSPSFEWEESGTLSIEYDPVFGGHALIGATSHDPNKSLFLFFEASYMGTFGEYDMSSANFFPISSLRHFSGQGIFFNFGLGFYFN